jgi:hypothetical protein
MYRVPRTPTIGTALKVVFYLAVCPLELLAAAAFVQLIARLYRRKQTGLTDYRFRKQCLAPHFLDDLPNRKTHCLLGS